jgi:hypothetical protein
LLPEMPTETLSRVASNTAALILRPIVSGGPKDAPARHVQERLIQRRWFTAGEEIAEDVHHLLRDFLVSLEARRHHRVRTTPSRLGSGIAPAP